MIATLESVERQTIDQVVKEASSFDKVILAIGPEGDFSPKEVEQALSQGWKAVNLGSLVLRSETAAIAGISILQHELTKIFKDKG